MAASGPRVAQCGPIAQLVEQATENRCVGGSIPSLGTTHPGDATFLGPYDVPAAARPAAATSLSSPAMHDKLDSGAPSSHKVES